MYYNILFARTRIVAQLCCAQAKHEIALGMIRLSSISSLSPAVKVTGFLVCYIAISLVCGSYYCSVPPSPDQSLYNYIAWQGIHGVQWYLGSFDVAWPGNLVIHDLGIRAFGVHQYTARITDFFLLQPAVLAIYFFLDSAGLRWAAIAAALFYPIIYVTSGEGIAGQRDIVAMHLLLISSVLLVTMSNRKVTLFLAALPVGCAIMLRPTYAAFAAAMLVAWFGGRRTGPTAREVFNETVAIAFGVVVFPAVFFIAGILSGTFGAWLESFALVLSVYQNPETRLYMLPRMIEVIKIYMLWPALAGSAGAIFWWRNRLKLHAALLAAMAFTSVLSFVVQNKGYGYHLEGFIPIFLISAFGAAELGLSATRQRRFVAGIAGTAIFLVLCAGIGSRIRHYIIPHFADAYSRPTSLSSEEAAIIQTESCENDLIFQWGWHFDAAFLAQRRSASRFDATPIFSEIKANDAHYQPWIVDFDRELEMNKPAFILLDFAALSPNTDTKTIPIKLTSERSPALVVLVSNINQAYSIRRRWADRVLYIRNNFQKRC